MIRLPETSLIDSAAAGLRQLQAQGDATGTYDAQVTEGKRLFGLSNQRGNAIFDEVKLALDRMCAGARRCAYCEDSVADEVEHVRPKDLYPQVVFAWSNYVYACGPCNGPKGSHFAVFISGAEHTEAMRKTGDPIVPPPDGDAVLIDPRTEDATQLMLLDLRETYLFTPLAAKGTRDHARADYTIKTLRLNVRPELAKARHEAYKDYVSHVRHHQHERDHGAQAAVLDELRLTVQRRQHPTVWSEMKRQRGLLPKLRALFAEVPEAVTW